MNKPDWKDAPKWAQWLAMDQNGAWYWYESKPETFGDFWDFLEEGQRAERADFPEWKETLEQRPQ